jgi:cytochrome c556
MQRCGWLLCLALLCLIAGSCRSRAPEPEYRLTATIKDIMDSLVDPSADTIWDSIVTTISAAGIEEKAPHTDEEWLDLRRSAIRLVEATNLLQMPGRHVAQPGEKAENPNVELGPEEIERRINADRAQWITLAHGLHDAAMGALRATDAKNVPALFEAGDKLDGACERCHQKYWYPPDANHLAPSLRK